MYDVLNISRYIIQYSNQQGYGVSCLKLQKLLYFLQAEFLLKYDYPLFVEKIEAWPFGPVIPVSYYRYILFGSMDIPTRYDCKNFSKDVISREHRKIINKLLDYFKDYSSVLLTDITIKQSPWINSFYRRSDNNEISVEDIKKYFM